MERFGRGPSEFEGFSALPDIYEGVLEMGSTCSIELRS